MSGSAKEFHKEVMGEMFGQERPKTYEVTACAHCREEISHLSAGDEHWHHCYNCQTTEGDTIEITIDQNGEEVEAVHE